MKSSLAPIDEATLLKVARNFLDSPNPQQQRFGRDLSRLCGLTSRQGPWADRCHLLGLKGTEEGSVCLLVNLRVAGLVWDGNQPQLHTRGFVVALYVPAAYPHVKPSVRLLEPIAYSPHVLHPCSPLDEASVPAELFGFLEQIRRQEMGWCCYIRSSIWTPAAEFDLALCLYLVSGIITGARVWGERASLNRSALNWFQREKARLPLGNPLPFPHEQMLSGSDWALRHEEEEEAIEWAQAEPGGVA